MVTLFLGPLTPIVLFAIPLLVLVGIIYLIYRLVS